MSKRKSECTHEEWAAHLQKCYEYRREWKARPENKEAQRLKDNKRNRRYAEKNREKLSEYQKQYRNVPGNKEKIAEYRKAYYENNPDKAEALRAYKKSYADKHRKKLSAYYRQRSTGMTPEVFTALLTIQGNRCAICGADISRKAFADHCHDSQTPRGLLCHNCNTAEGHIKQTGLSAAAFGERLQHYLDNPPAAVVKEAMGLAG